MMRLRFGVVIERLCSVMPATRIEYTTRRSGGAGRGRGASFTRPLGRAFCRRQKPPKLGGPKRPAASPKAWAASSPMPCGDRSGPKAASGAWGTPRVPRRRRVLCAATSPLAVERVARDQGQAKRVRSRPQPARSAGVGGGKGGLSRREPQTTGAKPKARNPLAHVFRASGWSRGREWDAAPAAIEKSTPVRPAPLSSAGFSFPLRGHGRTRDVASGAKPGATQSATALQHLQRHQERRGC